MKVFQALLNLTYSAIGVIALIGLPSNLPDLETFTIGFACGALMMTGALGLLKLAVD